jgi:hypothetical protein
MSWRHLQKMTAVLEGSAGTCGDRGHEGQMGGPLKIKRMWKCFPVKMRFERTLAGSVSG